MKELLEKEIELCHSFMKIQKRLLDFQDERIKRLEEQINELQNN